MSSLTAPRDWPGSRQAIERAGRALMLVMTVLIAGGSAMADQAPPNPPVTSPPAVTAPSSDAPAAPGKATPPPASPEPTGTPATVIDDNQIESVLGTQVRSPTGEDMGHLVDVLVDKSGQVRAAVIDFGGFFGVGNRKIAVDWHSLRFNKGNKANAIMIDLPRNQLRVSPVYKEGEPVVVLGGTAAPQPNSPAAAPAAASPTPGPVPAPPK